jgi:hypothetical protein
MLHHLVIGAIITGLNGIGLWHSVPLTGFSPSNGLLWRGFSTLEVAGSYYGLRYIKPYVFPENDAVLKEDLLLQHSINTEEFEAAKLALKQSSKAISSHSKTPRVTTPSDDAKSTKDSTSVYVTSNPPNACFEDSQPGKTPSVVFALFWLLFGMNLYTMKMMHDAKSQPSYVGLEEVMIDLTEELAWFRQEFRFLLPNLQEMAGAFKEASTKIEGLYKETSSLIIRFGESVVNSMGSIDTQLTEIRKHNIEIAKLADNIAKITRQLDWLNNVVEKTNNNDSDVRRISTQMSDYMIGANAPGTGRRFSTEPISPGTLPEPPKVRSAPPLPLLLDSKDSNPSSSRHSSFDYHAGSVAHPTPPSSLSGSPSPKARAKVPGTISANPLLTHPNSHTYSSPGSASSHASSTPGLAPNAPKATLSAPKHSSTSHPALNWNTRPSPPT